MFVVKYKEILENYSFWIEIENVIGVMEKDMLGNICNNSVINLFV